MYLVMHADVFKDGEWKKVGRHFKSSFVRMKSYLIDRPCDERNFVLYELLTGENLKQNEELTKITPIGAIKNEDGEYLLSLNDILRYNWDVNISNVGLISEWQYKRLKRDGIWPANRNRHVLHHDSKVVSPFEMDMILKDESLRECGSYYVRFEHNAHSIKDECKFFCEETIPALMRLVPQSGSYDDVRLRYTYKS